MTRPVRAIPPALRDLPQIDSLARDGKFRLLGDASEFAIARWEAASGSTGGWVFPNGAPLDFTADRYQP